MANAAHVWIGRMRGEGRENLRAADYPDATSLNARRREVDAELAAFCRAADPDTQASYAASDGTRYMPPVWQMALHIVVHSAHHRGQAITLMRQLGVRSIPGTDFSVFSRERPA